MEKKKFNRIISKFFRNNTEEKEEKNTLIRKHKIEEGAKDFAKRFETVMRELSNG